VTTRRAPSRDRASAFAAAPTGVASTTAPLASGEIPATMHALVKARAAAGAELREVPVPEPGPGELLVRVEAASLCGTDLHIYRWDEWAQHRLAGGLPRIFGHEMAGRVVKHGPGVSRAIPLGTQVAVETHLVDGTCYQCRTDREHACANMRIVGVDINGAFAEYIALPAYNAWPSDGLAPEIAAIMEPMGNAVHAAFVEEVAGQTVAVLGCGPIGLMSVAIVNLAGAARIFATDVNPERLEMARAMGADVLIDARGDVVDEIRRATGGVGVDVVLEMSGAEAAIRQGFEAVTNGGRVSLLGIPSRPITLDLAEEVIFKGLRVYGIVGRKMFETWYRTQALLAQGLDVSSIVTHRIPLARFDEAFELLAGGHAGKVVLLPQEA
jgi:threonine 3-dehydrogenase